MDYNTEGRQGDAKFGIHNNIKVYNGKKEIEEFSLEISLLFSLIMSELHVFSARGFLKTLFFFRS